MYREIVGAKIGPFIATFIYPVLLKSTVMKITVLGEILIKLPEPINKNKTLKDLSAVTQYWLQ